MENWEQRTLLFPQMSRAPIGAKTMPMIKRVGRTVFGVRMGCHAFRRCCLKAVSAVQSATARETAGSEDSVRTGWPPPITLILLGLGGVRRVDRWLFPASEESHGRGENRERTGWGGNGSW